ncbi:MAG: TIGR00725 family protein [Candidatus Aminicenantes bacterium]|nr:TIGR00725 family protein [Candidatus Aminicenantes bacterium]
MELKKMIRIGVIGGSKPDAKARQVAFKVGQLIAEKSAILICGGLSGVMEEASRGAKQAGGMTIGILPGNSPQDANPHIDVAIATGLGYGRNSLVAMNSDVIIAINGQFGTLTEIAYGSIYGKKIVGLETWDIEGVIKAESAEEAVNLALKNYFPLTS